MCEPSRGRRGAPRTLSSCTEMTAVAERPSCVADKRLARLPPPESPMHANSRDRPQVALEGSRGLRDLRGSPRPRGRAQDRPVFFEQVLVELGRGIVASCLLVLPFGWVVRLATTRQRSRCWGIEERTIAASPKEDVMDAHVVAASRDSSRCDPACARSRCALIHIPRAQGVGDLFLTRSLSRRGRATRGSRLGDLQHLLDQQPRLGARAIADVP